MGNYKQKEQQNFKPMNKRATKRGKQVKHNNGHEVHSLTEPCNLAASDHFLSSARALVPST